MLSINPLTVQKKQFIIVPTRGNNTLDLLFSNNCELVHLYEATKTVMPDHYFIKVITPSIPALQRNRKDSEHILGNLLSMFNSYSKDIDWDIVKSETGDIDWVTLQ